MRKNLFIASALVIGITSFASAQETTFKSLVSTLIGTVFNSLVTLAMVTAAAAFSFGIYKYVMGARSGDSNQIAKGNQFILWSIITLFIMASIWGIIAFAQGTFGIDSTISLPASAF